MEVVFIGLFEVFNELRGKFFILIRLFLVSVLTNLQIELNIIDILQLLLIFFDRAAN